MRTRVVTIIFIFMLITVAAWQSGRLSRIRRKKMPEAYQGYSADVPPMLNFVMAGLGGFRGIVAEILWFRVNRLQEEGRYIELVQLSEWITILEPHAAEAWAYNAWNMAYNISVMMLRPEDRLRWVQNGIKLLRDDAVRYNPKSAKLFRELAWLYQNKIGSDLDAAHLTYKLELAHLMQPLLNSEGTLIDTPSNLATLHEMRLDATLMKQVTQKFGPLDWRLAESHALYWALQSVKFATSGQRLLCRRAVYQPLMLMTFNGRFDGDMERNIWRTAPNPALALPTARYMKQTFDEFPSSNMRTAYLNFLIRAIQLLEQQGQQGDAQKLFDALKIALPSDAPMPEYDDVISNRMRID